MLKIGQNWGKIASYPPQCSTKIGTTVTNFTMHRECFQAIPAQMTEISSFALINEYVLRGFTERNTR